MYNYRIRFAKGGCLKYLSHLELIRTLERSLRRAGLPIDYTEGFHPHPKVGFGPALAVGIASDDEYFDLELREEIESPKIIEALNRSLPEGLRILEIKKNQNLRIKPLSAIINRVSYLCIILNNSGLKDRIIQGFDEFLRLTDVTVERPGKTGSKQVNIRPLVSEATILNNDAETLKIKLTGIIGSNGNMRPEEIIHWLDRGAPAPTLQILSITRSGLWHEEKGITMKPLDFCEKIGE
jgi:radical SAM-linked protein